MLLVALAAGCAPQGEASDASPPPSVAAVASPDPSPETAPPAQATETAEATQTAEPESTFLSSSKSDVVAFLEGAGTDPDAKTRCVKGSYTDPSRLTTAVWMPFSDALAINTVLTSVPEWSLARGDDNRMTVALRGEDQDATTAVCVMIFDPPIGEFGHDVMVIFSDDTWGEIGMY